MRPCFEQHVEHMASAMKTITTMFHLHETAAAHQQQRQGFPQAQQQVQAEHRFAVASCSASLAVHDPDIIQVQQEHLPVMQGLLRQ